MRLIDADALYEHTHYDDFETLIVDYEDIENAPTVDVVQVVRCGECKWWKCADDTEILRYGDCTHPFSAVRKNCLPNETWFCADGEEVKKDVRDEETV